jgi:hypothetical protein
MTQIYYATVSKALDDKMKMVHQTLTFMKKILQKNHKNMKLNTSTVNEGIHPGDESVWYPINSGKKEFLSPVFPRIPTDAAQAPTLQ